jgi:N-acetylglucosaminyldiphosphoundecaprenol N-acetyl-beta-D-mannosaminyltransferase
MKENILGVMVSVETYTSLLTKIHENIQQKQKAFIVAINPEKIMKAQESPSLKNLLNSATYQIPDGVGVLIASKLKKGQITDRITGIDLMLQICQMATEKGHRIFLYGAKPGVADEAKVKLEERFKGIKIVGTMDGYEKDNDKIIGSINKSEADILFVAKGSPAQELWITDHMNQITTSIHQGVGGSFDVICGNIKRAPDTFQKLGLEWLYRLALEPSRIGRQMALPRFLIKVLKSN